MNAAQEYELWRKRYPELAKLETSLDAFLCTLGLHRPCPPNVKVADRLLPAITIHAESVDPYLTRAYINGHDRSRYPGVFLHYFHRGDLDRELHNHPWEDSLSLVLTGGYAERYRLGRDGTTRERYVAPFSVNRIRHDTFHRITLATDHCWTLFIAGSRVAPEREDAAGWGFLDEATGHYEDERQRARRLRVSFGEIG